MISSLLRFTFFNYESLGLEFALFPLNMLQPPLFVAASGHMHSDRVSLGLIFTHANDRTGRNADAGIAAAAAKHPEALHDNAQR